VEPADEAAVLAVAEAWPAEQVELPDTVEATLPDGSTHILLLPDVVTPQAAVGILIGTREPGEPPWPPGEWLETENACFIRRAAIIQLRIVNVPKTTTATA
jgi:hypothetical protein